MSKKLFREKPPLKVGEWSVEQGGGAYIAFEEFVDIPGFEGVDIRIEFERHNSFEEVSDLVRRLRAAGFVFVVQK